MYLFLSPPPYVNLISYKYPHGGSRTHFILTLRNPLETLLFTDEATTPTHTHSLSFYRHDEVKINKKKAKK